MNSKILLAFIGAVCFVILIGLIISGVKTNYHYERDVGAYFDNARDCLTPDCMMEQLSTGKTAIMHLGLTDNDYGAYFFKKADNSMKFQYQHIDSIIERVQAVIDWKDKIYSTETQGVETMKDVYNEKMDNLRLYIHAEGYRSDWIAKDAWYVKNHSFIYFGLLWGILLFVLGSLFIGIAVTDEL